MYAKMLANVAENKDNKSVSEAEWSNAAAAAAVVKNVTNIKCRSH